MIGAGDDLGIIGEVGEGREAFCKEALRGWDDIVSETLQSQHWRVLGSWSVMLFERELAESQSVVVVIALVEAGVRGGVKGCVDVDFVAGE